MKNLEVNQLRRKPIRRSLEGDANAYHLNNKQSMRKMNNPQENGNENPTDACEKLNCSCEMDCSQHEENVCYCPKHKRNLIYPDLSQYEEEFLESRSPGKKIAESLCDDDAKPDSGFGFVWSIVAGLFTLLLGIIIVYILSPKDPDFTTELLIESLRNEFPNQPNFTFKQVKLAIKEVVTDGSEPKTPGILLLVSSSKAESSVLAFSKCLVSSLNVTKSVVEIDGGKYTQHYADDVKEKLDTKIRETFKDKVLNVLLVKNLDLIPAHAAMLFHSYCDHENAPFKRAVIIMTVTSQDEISATADSKTIDSYAIRVLQNSWKTLPDEQLECLLSRITIRVAAIMHDVASSNCKL